MFKFAAIRAEKLITSSTNGDAVVGFTDAFAARHLYVLSMINTRCHLCYCNSVLKTRKSFDTYDHTVIFFYIT